MKRSILLAAIAMATGAASCAHAATTMTEATPTGADDCFYKAVNAEALKADNAFVLMPGKALKAILVSCENKTRVEVSKYRSVRELKDDDMIPTLATPMAKPQDLIIE